MNLAHRLSLVCFQVVHGVHSTMYRLVIALCLASASAKPNGFYHQEYNYKTSSSAYKNHELQHQNEDAGFYARDGDLEGRSRPKVNGYSHHSEYVNPKSQYGYRAGTDRSSSFGELHAQDYTRQNYGMYGTHSNLQQLTSQLQGEMERELQRAIYNYQAGHATSYSQSQWEADRRFLEEELRRNMSIRMQDALRSQYGNQGIRGAYSYSIQNGRLQPTANYDNRELSDLTQQLEQNLIRNLEQQMRNSQQTRLVTEVHSRKNTYQRFNDNYDSGSQRIPVYYPQQSRPYPGQMQVVPNIPLQVQNGDSVTTIATRVQTDLNDHLNRLLDATEQRYFRSGTYQMQGVNYDNVLAQLQDQLRANITFLFDEELKRSSGGRSYQQQDVAGLRSQIENNLITKLNRDFTRQKEKFLQTTSYQVVPNNQYYASNYQDISSVQRQLQTDLSRQVEDALLRQRHYTNSGNYQATLDRLSEELNRNLTRQLEQYNTRQASGGMLEAQLANMRNQLQHDLMRQLQQGLQQSWSSYSSWSSSSSTNYQPVKGYGMSNYQSVPRNCEDCMMGDDPNSYQEQSQQTNDLTQQIVEEPPRPVELTQQVQTHDDLSQQMIEDQEIHSHDDLSQQIVDEPTHVLNQHVQPHPNLGGQIEDEVQEEPIQRQSTYSQGTNPHQYTSTYQWRPQKPKIRLGPPAYQEQPPQAYGSATLPQIPEYTNGGDETQQIQDTEQQPTIQLGPPAYVNVPPAEHARIKLVKIPEYKNGQLVDRYEAVHERWSPSSNRWELETPNGQPKPNHLVDQEEMAAQDPISDDLSQQVQSNDDLTQQVQTSEDLTQQIQKNDDFTQQVEETDTKPTIHLGPPAYIDASPAQQARAKLVKIPEYQNGILTHRYETVFERWSPTANRWELETPSGQPKPNHLVAQEQVTSHVQSNDDLSQKVQTSDDLTQQVQNNDDLTQQVEETDAKPTIHLGPPAYIDAPPAEQARAKLVKIPEYQNGKLIYRYKAVYERWSPTANRWEVETPSGQQEPNPLVDQEKVTPQDQTNQDLVKPVQNNDDLTQQVEDIDTKPTTHLGPPAYIDAPPAQQARAKLVKIPEYQNGILTHRYKTVFERWSPTANRWELETPSGQPKPNYLVDQEDVAPQVQTNDDLTQQVQTHDQNPNIRLGAPASQVTPPPETARAKLIKVPIYQNGELVYRYEAVVERWSPVSNKWEIEPSNNQPSSNPTQKAPINDDLTQQVQTTDELTQQAQTIDNLTQQVQTNDDLNQQVQTTDELTQQVQGNDNLAETSEEPKHQRYPIIALKYREIPRKTGRRHHHHHRLTPKVRTRVVKIPVYRDGDISYEYKTVTENWNPATQTWDQNNEKTEAVNRSKLELRQDNGLTRDIEDIGFSPLHRRNDLRPPTPVEAQVPTNDDVDQANDHLIQKLSEKVTLQPNQRQIPFGSGEIPPPPERPEPQPIGPMQYVPQPVYADIDGHQVQVGTTRTANKILNYKPQPVYADINGNRVQIGTTREETGPNQRLYPMRPKTGEERSLGKPQEPGPIGPVYHASVSEEIQPEEHTEDLDEPPQPLIIDEVIQVKGQNQPDEPSVRTGIEQISTTTTGTPGFWKRVGNKIRDKATEIRHKIG